MKHTIAPDLYGTLIETVTELLKSWKSEIVLFSFTFIKVNDRIIIEFLGKFQQGARR